MELVVGISAAAITGFLLVAAGVAAAGESRLECTESITPRIVRLARKWARARGLPVEWVLATIQLESGGRSCLIGDEGRSYGLMQVNTEAHADLLDRMGVGRADLLRPDVNIGVGTALLRRRWAQIHQATKGRSAVPVGTLVALAYWGPGPTLNALRAGTDPRDANPRRVARWNAALSETATLV